MYAYLSPMKEEKAFFGESKHGFCSFCKGSDEKKIRDAKSENKVKRYLRFVGPVLSGIGGVILIKACIFAACNGGLMSNSSGQHGIVRHASKKINHKSKIQQGNVQNGGRATAQYNTGQCQKSPYILPLNNYQNPYPPSQVNQGYSPGIMGSTNFQTGPMTQQQQPQVLVIKQQQINI